MVKTTESKSDLIYKLEALLFASGDKISTEELAQLTKASEKEVKAELKHLQDLYKERDTSLAIFDEEHSWKINVKESYLNLVRKIVSRTELSKSVMETLAVLAWKAPMKQSALVDIRSNKAYDHIAELQQLDFITKETFGRTYMLKLTQKFYDYFELKAQKDIEKKFGKFDQLEQLSPQKHVQDFTPEELKQVEEEEQKEHEEKLKAIDDEKQQMHDELAQKRSEDVDFLKDMDKRISNASNDSNATEFSNMIPQSIVEEEIDEEETGDSTKNTI